MSRHTHADACPSEETLLAVSGGMPLTPLLSDHLAWCKRCLDILETLGSDDRFSRRFAITMRADAGPRDPQDQFAPEVPGYTIEGELARGGQGVVYRAVQHETNRPVALKAILRGTHASQREIARFEREVEIAASLRHANIVTVFEARLLHDGRHVLAMDLVEGVPLSVWAASAPKDRAGLRARLELIRDAARAVQYAHSKGVIHRDLKPGNILVEHATRSPKILDFGLARRGHEAEPAAALGNKPAQKGSTIFGGLTFVGAFQGTPAYAAPEQFDGEPGRLDVRTDVYALGVMLHELLTGQAPFADTKDQLTLIASSKRSKQLSEPSSLVDHAGTSTLPRIGPDIDAVVARATAPSRDHRYATADALADDLDSLLAGEAVAARSHERWYRVRKAFRRHRAAVGGMIALVLGLSLFVVTTAWQNSRLASQLRTTSLREATALARANDPFAAQEILWKQCLDSGLDTSRLWEAALTAPPEARRLLWAMLEVSSRHTCAAAHQLRGPAVFVSASTERASLLSLNGEFHDLDVSNLSAREKPRRVFGAGSSPIVIAEGTAIPNREPSVVIVRNDRMVLTDVSSGVPLTDIPGSDLARTRFPPATADGSAMIVLGIDRTIRVYDLPSLEWRCTLPMLYTADPIRFSRHLGFAWDGEAVLFVDPYTAELSTYSARDGSPIDNAFGWSPEDSNRLNYKSSEGMRIIADPSGRSLAFIQHRRLAVIDTEGICRASASDLTVGENMSARFSPSGRWLLTYSHGDTVPRLRDARTLEEITTFHGHEGGLSELVFTPDERSLLTIDTRHTLRRWPLPGAGWRHDLSRGIPTDRAVNHAAFDAFGTLLVAVNNGEILMFADPRSAIHHAVASGLKDATTVDALPRRGGVPGKLIVGGLAEAILVHTFSTNGPATQMPIRLDHAPSTHVFTMKVSPDGLSLVAGFNDSTIRVWNTTDWTLRATRRFERPNRVPSVRWLPDSSGILAAVEHSRVLLLDPAALATINETPPHSRQV